MTSIELVILVILGCMAPCILSVLRTQLADQFTSAPITLPVIDLIPTPTPDSATPTPLIDTKSDIIVFDSIGQWGEWKIFLIAADGSGRIALTEHTGSHVHERDPVWSPDGKYIAFADDECLYVSDLRTARPGCLVDDFLEGPWWLSDDNQILYQAWDSQQQAVRMYATNLDGSNTTLWLDPDPISELVWAPDGSKGAFAANGIYVVNADGTGEKQLTSTIASDFDPAWSPDSRQLLFLRNGSEIYLINVDGTGLRRVTDQAFNTTRPQWSPDGKTILFESVRDGNLEVYCINTDGTALTRLTNNPAVDKDSIWSPDGEKIVYVSDTEGKYQLYMMNPDGSGQKRLTWSDGHDENPVWRPRR